MHPPAPIILRKAIEDYKIPNRNYTIPKGTQIFIPNYGFHYDKVYWPEPEKFDPERFSPEEIAKRPNFSFLPFGESIAL
jgi:cytochrome P450 family 6